ncbi:MAG: permease-like cell division protein FtsX [Thiotrichaceae bacterium]
MAFGNFNTRKPKLVPQRNRLQSWLSQHIDCFFASFQQLIRAPLANLMTIAVLGIALALPASLYLLLENVQQVSQDWSGTAQISLFLKQKVSDNDAKTLTDMLYKRPEIKSIRIISRDEALSEYKTLSGFSEALKVMENNPLPIVLVIQPIDDISSDATQELYNSLTKLPEVETAQFDMRWLNRLYAMMEIAKRGILVLASLFALGVLLVIGNTIRLTIYNRRDEIEVVKLLGATDVFIRRPFLYSGFWYGFLGGITAWLVVNLSFWWLQDPVRQLAALYHSQFELIMLNMFAGMVLLLGGAVLGVLGAGLAVGRHLKEIQPR